MKNLLLFVFLLISCSDGHVPTIKIVEYKTYDTPAKSQLSIRVILPDASESEVRSVMKDIFDKALSTRLKYHPQPTHIFLYAYRDSASIKSANWIAKQEKNQDVIGILEMNTVK
jgi:hypothetical protein